MSQSLYMSLTQEDLSLQYLDSIPQDCTFSDSYVKPRKSSDEEYTSNAEFPSLDLKSISQPRNLEVTPDIITKIKNLGLKLGISTNTLTEFLIKEKIYPQDLHNWLRSVVDITEKFEAEDIEITLKKAKDPEVEDWNYLVLEILVDTDVRRIMRLWDSLSGVTREPIGRKIYITIKLM